MSCAIDLSMFAPVATSLHLSELITALQKSAGGRWRMGSSALGKSTPRRRWALTTITLMLMLCSFQELNLLQVGWSSWLSFARKTWGNIVGFRPSNTSSGIDEKNCLGRLLLVQSSSNTIGLGPGELFSQICDYDIFSFRPRCGGSGRFFFVGKAQQLWRQTVGCLSR